MFDSRRISLFCPVDFWLPLGGWLLMVSLTMILAFVSFVFCQGMWLSFSSHLVWALVWCGVGCLFSMESLILAQDERWRRA